MLVTFSCSAYANITMFGDVAIRLLKMMGHSGNIPGAILAEDLPKALEQLEKGIKNEKRCAEAENPDDNEDQQPVIALSHRALPLIELLNAAIEADCNVMWDK